MILDSGFLFYDAVATAFSYAFSKEAAATIFSNLVVKCLEEKRKWTVFLSV